MLILQDRETGVSYRAEIDEDKQDSTILIGQIKSSQYKISLQSAAEMTLVSHGGVKVSFKSFESITDKGISNVKNHHSNNWICAGILKDIEDILLKYPPLEYEHGMFHNNRTIERVSICSWNVGVRVIFPTFIPHGDNSTNFHKGTAMYIRGLHDQNDKNHFQHKYVDSNFKDCCGSNGNSDSREVYVRKF